MKEETIILFDPGGTARCLYSEVLDLRRLGRLRIRRATRIEFSDETQLWNVFPAEGARQALFSAPTRRACLEWEQPRRTHSMHAELRDYIRAGFAGIWLVTPEEVRAEALLQRTAADLGWSLHSWTVTGGLVCVDTGAAEPVNDPLQAAMSLQDLPEKSILVLRDFQQFLGDPGQPADPVLTRTLREQLRRARCTSRAVVILGCRLVLPPELEKDFAVLHLGLPGTEDLRTIAEGIATSAGITPE